MSTFTISGALNGQTATQTASFTVQVPALVGAYPAPAGGSPAAFETQIAGRQLGVVNRYEAFDDPSWPSAADQALMAQGRLIHYCWADRLKAGGNATWTDIAAGKHDAQILAKARQLAPFAKSVLLGFDNEMDGHVRLAVPGNTVAQFAPAFRRIHSVAAAAIGGASWCWIPSGNNPANQAAMYPGDDVVDWIGVDPYDETLAKGSPLATYEPFLNWLSGQSFGKGKRVGIFETGVDSNQPDAAIAAWIEQVPAAVAELGYGLWDWFNSTGSLGNTAIIPGSRAAAAFAAAAAQMGP